MAAGVEESGTAGAGDIAAGRSDGREGDFIVEIQLAGAEVTILQADIDVAAYRHVDAGEQLPCPRAVLIAELLDAGAAETGTGITADAAVAAHVEERVDHAREHRCFAAEVERSRSEGVARRRVDAGQERIVDGDVLELGVLVAELALEPEHAEVVAADKVDVIAGLVLDPGDVVEGNVGHRRIG